jgi:hypothetical protein
MQTPSATIGIRGGLILVDLSPDGQLQVIFGYGAGVTVTGLNGLAQTITRPGFQVTVAGRGAAPSTPSPTPPGAAAALLAQLDGRPGGNGGARTIPTDATVANSGIAAAVSTTAPAGVQVQAQQPPRVSNAVQQATTTVQVAANSPVVQQSITASQAQMTPTTPVTPVTPVMPPPPPPVVISYAGLFKDTPGSGTATTQGFINQGPSNRIAYTGGTLTYPAGQPANGVFATALGPGSIQFPLAPGSTSPGFVNFGPAGTQSPFGPFTGTSYMARDSTFFYANLVPTNPAIQQERGFIFGGQPVNQSFYAPTATPQFLSFQVQPDGAFASGSQSQTIPFLPPQFGGASPNASVSDLYIATGAASPFGSNASSTFVSPKFLQASLAINGQGANQTSALVVATGEFFTYTGTGTVVAAGPVRGTVMLSATSPLVHIASGLATVPDGNGNNLFGGNTLSGFVLDQNQYDFGGSFVPALALAAQFGATTANYAFNQPVTTTPLPANVPGTRQALNEAGYFGGIMTHTTNPTTGSPYVLTGTVSPLQSTLANSRVAATFTGADPFTPGQSGINSMVLSFGDVTGGTNSSRGTYINNNIFAATDSPITASSINGNPLPLPPNSTTTAPSPSIAMVTSGTVPNNSWMPPGITPCSCQYLQWGYWTGQVPSTATTGLGVARTDRAFINTWIAGQPTVTMPAGGVGTFNGAAVGTVFNNGATYLAAGGFNQTYNFGSRSGTLNITNFDGQNYTSTVSGSGTQFSGRLTGPANRSGAVAGSFYGPSAAETGGSFNIQSVSGLRYLASGIFAGR